MQAGLLVGGTAAGLVSRLGSRPGSASAIASQPATPAHGCPVGCNSSARLPQRTRSSYALQRLGRRHAVACRAAAKNFYELLGLSQSASDRDIKSAYRKLAMKLHPDVNKAPDAQKRFMEVKVAYETLSDTKQRAEYDRRLRMGGYTNAGSRPGGAYGGSASGSGYGSAPGGSGWGPYGPYGTGPNYTQEPVPGLDDLIRDLEKEFTAWANQRGQGAKAKSLIEELEDLGGEFLDFLEESLGIKDEPQAGAGPSASGSSSGQPRDTRSAAERFDDFWKQYGDGSTVGGNSSTPSGSSSATTGGGPARGGPGAGAGASAASGRTAGTSSSSYSSSTPSSGAQRQGPSKSSEDDIEAELLALKKKLNKL